MRFDRERVIRTKVKGVTFRNDEDGTDRQRLIRRRCRPGVELVARREPHNPRDGNAVGLWAPGFTGLARVGYLGSEIAEDLADALRSGWTLRVVVAQTTGGGPGEFVGVNVEVTVSPPRVREPFDWSPLASAARGAASASWSAALALGRVAVACGRALRAGYRSAPARYRAALDAYSRLPEWAQPVVWGVGVALPVVVLMAVARMVWARPR